MRKENQSLCRKPYIKPCVAVENFALDQFIAVNCTVTYRDPEWKRHLMELDFFTYAAVERTQQFAPEFGCAVHADEVTDDMDFLCYHTATSPLFGS